MAERLAENYWRLDPFLRARSLYDRTGVIGLEGRLDFYPKALGSAASNTTAATPAITAGGADDDLD